MDSTQLFYTTLVRYVREDLNPGGGGGGDSYVKGVGMFVGKFLKETNLGVAQSFI